MYIHTHTHTCIYIYIYSGSGNLVADNFNPVMYLLENHCSTNFKQLSIGLENLKREVETISQSPAEFIRDNLDSFIQCFDTLSDIPLLHCLV